VPIVLGAPPAAPPGGGGSGPPVIPPRPPPPPPVIPPAPPLLPGPPSALDRLYADLGAVSLADTSGVLRSWLAGPAAILQRLDDLCRDSANGPGWSVLLDVNRCPTYALPWLGQIVGVRLDPSMPDAAMRLAIQTEQGWQRGTPAAIVATAQRYLGGSGTVTISERDTSPYHFTVAVYGKDLIGLDYAGLSKQYPTYAALGRASATYAGYTSSGGSLVAALTAVKPAGLQMSIVVVSGESYGQLRPQFATYGALSARFGTYQAMTTYSP